MIAEVNKGSEGESAVMTLYRGISVPPWQVESTMKSLHAGILKSERQYYFFKQHIDPLSVAKSPILSYKDTSDKDTQKTRLPASFACGDLEGALFYAWNHTDHLTHKVSKDAMVPIVVEFNLQFSEANVDPNDFLYSAFLLYQEGASKKDGLDVVRRIMQGCWGERIGAFLDIAEGISDIEHRHCICELSVTDGRVVRGHYENKNLIAGKTNTRFHSAFKVPAQIPQKSVRNVWIPNERIEYGREWDKAPTVLSLEVIRNWINLDPYN